MCTNETSSEKKFREALKSLMKNRKYSVLHIIFLRHKKMSGNKKYSQNLGWICKYLNEWWGFEFNNSESYSNISLVQEQLRKQVDSMEFDKVVDFAEFVVNQTKQKLTDKYYFFKEKNGKGRYRQVHMLYKLLSKYLSDVNSIILWIKEEDVDLYNRIISDKDWTKSLGHYAMHIHKAFHRFLIRIAKDLQLTIQDEKGEHLTASKIYKNIQSHFVDHSNKDLVFTDGLLIRRLNELRNATAHNAKENGKTYGITNSIHHHIGLAFLKSIALAWEKLTMIKNEFPSYQIKQN